MDGWFIARDDVLGVALDEAYVLYDPVEGRAHVLNGTAATIWGMVLEPTTIAALVSQLHVDGDTSAETVRRDVARMVSSLADQGLLATTADERGLVRESTGEAPITDVEHVGALRTTTFEVLDRRVAFACESTELVADIEWFADPLSSPKSADVVIPLPATTDFTRTIPARFNRFAAESTQSTVVHAAGVVNEDVAIAFPGGPGSGKSTLVAQAARRGFGYLSDEALGLRAIPKAPAMAPAVLGADSGARTTESTPRTVGEAGVEVVAYPKRLALELGSWSLFPDLADASTSTRAGFDPTRVRWVDPRLLSPDALAWRRSTPGPRLAAVVASSYEPDGDVTVDRLSPVDAMTMLIGNTFNLAVMKSTGLETLREVASSVPVYRLRHGGVERGWSAIEALLLDVGRGPRS
jgi:hypothetical protein